ncbi:glutamine synthetase family protein [Amycolatopsis sp. YIM 10]|uniref:glutamine synthetase family protein n=1 Tax=Amycolatopsis sp. YIM 10 TaxID=2653857 RepID=UPI00128FD642|nr:glutamine synthetase family protein [Amycolatopsis sp. YIM 10]QFU91353.1 Glutamine synthetase [Amycolatopsis sp. YIM 10]
MDQHDREARAQQARGIAADLGERGIAAVVVTWVDTSGITRAKAVPTARLGHAAAWGIGASPVFDAFLVDDSAVSGRFAGGPAGDLRLHPDLDRLTALAAQPGWAWAPADRYQQDGTPHPADPRLLARQAVARLAEHGLTAQVAFEIEWCVSRGDGDEFVPASSGPAYGMSRITDLPDYLRELLEALSAQGIAVEQLHPEYAVGQFEVSVAATDPVGAADLLVLVRETVRAVGHRHGLRTTFAPKVVAGGVGNGGHVHLSLWRDGTNLMSDGDGWHGLTEQAEAFAGGILDRLPGLLAIGAPSVASYLRLVPSHWAGPFRCWGWENREAALRLVSGVTGNGQRAANLEIKAFDGAANPYLVVAALLVAGTTGIGEQAALPEPIQVDPASLPEGTVQRLPTQLEAAVAAFEADPALRKALGEELVDTVVTVRRGEVALFDGRSAEEIVARTRWRY